ncbi:MAG: hypothetical protein FD149_1066 [Rhodospirillaceae bacterium]|nr:MAG: hypothetical protein FD149_1066 [Rhodospirillaceae bacterium]
MSDFARGIGKDFVKRLNEEYEKCGWWHAISSDPELFIAIRKEYLDVYLKGNRLLELRLKKGQLVGETHYKYLLLPNVPKHDIQIDNGMVVLPDASALFCTEVSNVRSLKRAADPYAGGEKDGVHKIVMSNPNVIDVEVALSIEGNGEDASAAKRIDFVALSPAADGAQLVFFEAKLFSNKGVLRAEGDDEPQVVKQIEDYRNLLVEHAADLERSYRVVCGNLSALKGVQERYAKQADLMRDIAAGRTPLHVNEAVRLVVFDFDEDQRDGKIWTPHRKKLDSLLGKRLLLRGNPKEFTRGISTPE